MLLEEVKWMRESIIGSKNCMNISWEVGCVFVFIRNSKLFVECGIY